jgi:hypothetical protein
MAQPYRTASSEPANFGGFAFLEDCPILLFRALHHVDMFVSPGPTPLQSSALANMRW